MAAEAAEVIRNHSKSGLLGAEFRLPFGKLLRRDFTGLFRINLRKPGFECLRELGRFLRCRVDGQDDLAVKRRLLDGRGLD